MRKGGRKAEKWKVMTNKGRREACQHQEPAQIEAQMASVSEEDILVEGWEVGLWGQEAGG